MCGVPSGVAHRPGRLYVAIATAIVACVALVALARVATSHGRSTMIPTPNVSAAAAFSSTPQPERSDVTARIGPGASRATIYKAGYRVTVTIGPNRSSRANAVSVALLTHGRPVHHTHIGLTISMLDMDMGQQVLGRLREAGAGRYERRYGALGMPGHWGMRFNVEPPDGKRFSVVVVDRMGA
jgi:hypothetical protein